MENNRYTPAPAPSLALAIFALALGSFAIGMSEFSIMGLLAEVCRSMSVTLAQGSHFISAYAIGVVIGAPLFSLLTTQLQRKHQLKLFMALFLAGNVASVLATDYHALVLARFVSGLPHGAFLGVAALAAASLVSPDRRGKAVGNVLLGLTLASLLGNPLAAMLGEYINWRWAFGTVALIALVDVALIAAIFPKTAQEPAGSPLKEIKALMNRRIWLTLGIAAIGFGGMFSVISYISPVVTYAVHLSHSWLPVILFAFGLGMVAGNLAGGWAADKKVMLSMFCILLWSIAVLLLFPLLAPTLFGAILGSFLIGTNLALCAPLQVRLMQVAGKAQTLAATLNHSAFNIANALGASVGAYVVENGYPVTYTATYGAILPLLGLVIFLVSLLNERVSRPRPVVITPEA
ncbi:MFS transporter [Chimaeribacter arupi]|uniref:MFS transporter n=1 Tax=Chimaeribacter arupi TaxID=2060066 RepID=UPI000C7A4A44|nr:MFS transporter [Chimaeribacter arupi]PLR29693.1 MFS transporter [Chimaeribacter arupi]